MTIKWLLCLPELMSIPSLKNKLGWATQRGNVCFIGRIIKLKEKKLIWPMAPNIETGHKSSGAESHNMVKKSPKILFTVHYQHHYFRPAIPHLSTICLHWVSVFAPSPACTPNLILSVHKVTFLLQSLLPTVRVAAMFILPSFLPLFWWLLPCL